MRCALLIAALLVGEGTFVDLGFGLPGFFGFTPSLAGEGTLQAGDPITITVSQAAPSTFGHMVIGADADFTPFKGGTMVPEVTEVIFSIPTRKGLIFLTGTWPEHVPSGTTFYLQCWIEDNQAVKGFAASNALQINVP